MIKVEVVNTYSFARDVRCIDVHQIVWLRCVHWLAVDGATSLAIVKYGPVGLFYEVSKPVFEWFVPRSLVAKTALHIIETYVEVLPMEKIERPFYDTCLE